MPKPKIYQDTPFEDFNASHPDAIVLGYEDDDQIVVLDYEHHDGATLTRYQWKSIDLGWQPCGEIQVTKGMYRMMVQDMPRYQNKIN